MLKEKIKSFGLEIKSLRVAQSFSRRCSEFLGLRWTPRLEPLSGLEVFPQSLGHNNELYEWEAVSSDSQFSLTGGYPMPGWNMLEIVMEHDQPHAALRIFFNTGKGYNSEESIFLPLKKGKMTKRLCYIPFNSKKIRLDPMETTGCFSIKEVRFVWLMPGFAYNRLTLRLHKLHDSYKDRSLGSIKKIIQDEAAEGRRSWRKVAVSHYEETFMHCAPSRHYRYWLEHVEPMRVVSESQVSANLFKIDKKFKVLVSLLLPTFNAPDKFLEEAIASVVAQRYTNWQLCIIDDGSSYESTIAKIKEWQAKDDRIHVVFRDVNTGVSSSCNAGLDLVKGEFVALMGHADVLSPNALYHVVETLSRYPDADLLYSDEDKLDKNSNRFDPYFKPRWNPDLLLAKNYIANLSVMKVSRLRSIGGFRAGFEGGHNHDVLLRFTHDLPEKFIKHIPFILYHSRSLYSANNKNHDDFEYAGLKAVSDHVSRINPSAEAIAGPVPESYRVLWPVPDKNPLVSLLIPTRDGIDILRPCVNAILKNTVYANFEVLILDNQSRCHETLEYMSALEREDSRVRVLRWDKPFNYSSINNFGVRHSKGSVIGLVNNDIEPINNNWLCEMVSHASRPEIGCVGAKLYYPNDTIQHAGVILGLGGVAGHSHKFYAKHHPGYFHRLHLVQNLSAVTAACLLVRKSVFESVGGLNEEHLAVAFNDVDLCLKVREAGYRNLWTPHAELYHHESVSRGADDSPKKHARFKREVSYMRRTWGPQLDSDPAYNPNLTLAYEDFSLR